MSTGYRQPDNTPSATYNASSFALGDRQQTALQCDVNGKLLVNAGTITASLGGFTPSGTYTTPLSVSSVSSNTAINGSDPVQMVTNVGTVTAYVNLGTSNAVTATTSDIPISAGASVALTVGANTYLAAITASNSTTLNIAGGSGLLTGIAGSPSISGSNPAAGSTGSAVPSSASYGGVNIGGTLRGQTGVNPSGTVYAADMDITSVGGATVSFASGVLNIDAVNFPATVDTNTGNASASTPRVVLASNQPTVAISAASLPLPTGAATAAKQPALGTAGTASTDVLTVQGITGMTALKVDGSGVTQPISAASLPLPTGASTAAKQPALGTAGSASADVLTVQGITSMTPLKVDGSGVTQPVSGTVTANAGTNLNTSALALESGGNLATLAGAVTASVVQSNTKQINGVVPLMGNGVTGTGSQRVTIASNSTSISQWGQGATAATAPPNAVMEGLLGKTALPTAVSDGQLVAGMADKYGRAIVRSAPRELYVTIAKRTTGASGTFLASQGAGVYADPYRVVIANSSSGALLVSLLDGTNTYPFEVPAQSTVGYSGSAGDATPAASTATPWTYTISASSTKVFIHGQFILNK